jgi:hypothetical protein
MNKGEFTFKNDKEFIQISNILNKNILQFNNLEAKLNNAELKEEESDIVSSSSEKYLLYKRVFEEGIKLCPESSHKVLTAIFEGYNGLMNNLLQNVNKLTHLANESELHITSKYTLKIDFKNIKRKYIDLAKRYDVKSNENKRLRAKLIEEGGMNKSADNIVTKKLDYNESPEKDRETTMEPNIGFNNKSRMVTSKKNLILVINNNALEDLDAIYFFDKIDMRAHSTSHKTVPKLDLQMLDRQKKAVKNIIPVI